MSKVDEFHFGECDTHVCVREREGRCKEGCGGAWGGGGGAEGEGG